MNAPGRGGGSWLTTRVSLSVKGTCTSSTLRFMLALDHIVRVRSEELESGVRSHQVEMIGDSRQVSVLYIFSTRSRRVQELYLNL